MQLNIQLYTVLHFTLLRFMVLYFTLLYLLVCSGKIFWVFFDGNNALQEALGGERERER
jgi:hypothetical protein